MTEIDLLADSTDQGNSVPDTAALKQVSSLVASWDKINSELKAMATKTAILSAQKKEIENRLLPDAMASAGTKKLVTTSGRTVEVDDIVNGNIPAPSTIEKAKGSERDQLQARRIMALEVVRSKWPGLVKTELVVTLGIGETELATRVALLIRDQFSLEPEIKENINPNTLNAHFRELKSEGKLADIPVEPFSLYVGPYAKIK